MIYTIIAILGIGGGFAGLAWGYWLQGEVGRWRSLPVEAAQTLAEMCVEFGPFPRSARRDRESIRSLLTPPPTPHEH